MRIIPGIPGAEVAAPTTVASSTETPAPAASAASNEALQSAVLQPALSALNEMADIDHAKVAALRDALAKGELPFDASKLATLIESYHRAGGGEK